ncbi:MAG: Alkaline phosphatase [archaeon GW2011_AR5]|nr:MAG: Alkaline phosphatase [archaeon GW2011_AR5]MBS3051496.1 metallophosphoesterase [Candidatus Aenigmarchaeota archaeon]
MRRLTYGVLTATLTASLFSCSEQQKNIVSPSPSSIDACANIEGIQSDVPPGVQVEDGNCDLCANLPGFQPVVPERHSRNPEAWTCTPVPDTPKPVVTVEFSGAGDIYDQGSQASETTGALLPPGGLVFTLGDNAYPDGSDRDFEGYDRTRWGANKGRTRPTAGNHEYHTRDAAVYFRYFGIAPDGYYAFMHGDWLVIALNTNAEANISSELSWLEGILAAFGGKCALAYGHHPWRTSGPNRDIGHMEAFAGVLQRYKAEMLLSGHNHNYERFEQENGLLQIVAGTGGHRQLYDFPFPQPSSRVRIREYGIVKLKLSTNGYHGEFVTQGGARDMFEGLCR